MGVELAVGYLIAWAVRKARRVAGKLDEEVDVVLDASLERLHDVVVTKLGDDSALATLEAEAAIAEAKTTEGETSPVSQRTHTRVNLALEEAIEKDGAFAERLTEAVERLHGLTGQAGAAGVDLRGASGVQVNQASGNLQVNRFG